MSVSRSAARYLILHQKRRIAQPPTRAAAATSRPHVCVVTAFQAMKRDNHTGLVTYADTHAALAPSAWLTGIMPLVSDDPGALKARTCSQDRRRTAGDSSRSEEHTSELQSLRHLV